MATFKYKQLPALSQADIERFWRHAPAVESDRCWEWQGGVFAKQYGCFCINRKAYYAHRIAYVLGHGIDPGSSLVCHACDNPRCCNPKHLFLGSHKDNAADMVSKGRSAAGEKHWRRSAQYIAHKQLADQAKARLKALADLAQEQFAFAWLSAADNNLARPKNPAAVALGRKGGAAKHPRKGFGSLTPERRAEIAAKAVAAKRAKATAAAPTPAPPGPTV